MKALVLVGGEGTRLRPLTHDRPKPLLPVANVPFIERTLRRLAEAGCDEAVLSIWYRPEVFEAVATAAPLPVRLAVEDAPLGTGGAIGYAGRGFDGTFLVLNGDVLTDLDLAAVLEAHRRFGGEATIVLTPVEDPSRFGVVPTDASGRVERFIEKPAPGTAPTNLVNAGTYVCEPAMLARIPPGGPVSVERDVFPEMAAEGVLYALAPDAYWLDFGTPDSYVAANVDCLRGALAEPLPGCEGPSGVRVEGDVVVDSGAEVVGPVVLGRGAVVEAGARVGPAVAVGPDARICADAVVREAVVLEGAKVGDGAFVERAVVGFGSAVEAGAELRDGAVG